jgi:RDD family
MESSAPLGSIADSGSAGTYAAPGGSDERDQDQVLSSAFRGLVPASTGRRLAAFSLDFSACVTAGILTYFLMVSPILAVLVAGEVAVALVVWEARRGTSLGQRVFGMWTTAVDAPRTPGPGRTAARAAITGLGAPFFAVGAWVVVGSSAWDGSGTGRGWQDRIAGTRTVMAPQRRRASRGAAGALSAGMRRRYGQQVTGWTQDYAGPQVKTTFAAAATAAPPSAPVADLPQQKQTEGPVQSDPLHTQSLESQPNFSQQWAPETAIAEKGERSAAGPGGLLFSFDTGQQVRAGMGAIGVLGRHPVAVEGDSPQTQYQAVREPEMTLSKRHVSYMVRADGLWIADLESTNGSAILHVDGSAAVLPPGQWQQIPDGARVQLGMLTFSVSALS